MRIIPRPLYRIQPSVCIDLILTVRGSPGRLLLAECNVQSRLITLRCPIHYRRLQEISFLHLNHIYSWRQIFRDMSDLLGMGRKEKPATIRMSVRHCRSRDLSLGMV